ncbi:MAG: hypothetical protein U0031_09520 [Thermomicrobiales bacterium]
MDAERFDTIARSLAARLSRRTALRRGGAGLVAGIAPLGWVRSTRAAQEQQVCTDPARPGVGCACTTGTEHPCGENTLLCCAADPNAAPGSPGVCTPSSVGCNPRGLTCTTHGCRCDGGIQHACDDPLVCCPDNPGLPGGPGKCVRQEHCNPQNCTGEGCSCHSGVRNACDDGFVCCTDDSSLAGGPGRCEQEAICFRQQCQASTNPCPSQCGSGAFCQHCCSGYCGSDGHCGTPPCSGVGCECTAGVEGTCAEGLVCCQSVMNGGPVPGGPGMCATHDGCGNSADGASEETPTG